MAHSQLSTAPEINAMGFSQGGLLARYIAQGCDISGKVRNLVTVGTPNMGLVEAPACQPFAERLLSNFLPENHLSDFQLLFLHRYAQQLTCTIETWILDIIVVYPFGFGYFIFQYLLPPSSYYRPPELLLQYQKHSIWLPFLNNEVNHIDFEMYRNRIMGINSFTAIEWDADTAIYPRSSTQFDQTTTLSGKIPQL